MAQKVTVQLVDDLDSAAAADLTTVTFGLDGATYEIDLTANNAAELRNRLDDFVDSARRPGGRVKQNGFDLSDRGRIPGNVIEAFD